MWSDLMFKAGKSNNKKLIEDSLNKKDLYNELNHALLGAASRGHLGLIQWIDTTQSCKKNWSDIAWEAAYGNHLYVVKYCGNKIDDHRIWDRIMCVGAKHNNLNMIEYAESKGGSDLNKALVYAVHYKQWECIRYLEMKGAKDSFMAIYEVFYEDLDNTDAAEYLHNRSKQLKDNSTLVL